MLGLYFIGALFILLAFGIKYFKWYFLIAGYNTMSKAQKDNVDIKGLGNLIGNFMFAIASIIFAGGLSNHYKLIWLQTILMVSIFPLSILLLILAQKYDHNTKNKIDKTSMGLVVGISIVAVVLSSLMIFYGAKEVNISLDSERIHIGGIYSKSIPLASIKEIELAEEIPKILKKVNGFNMGPILKGKFDLDGYGLSNLYIHSSKSPFIIIKTENTYYIINYKDPHKTNDLYKELKWWL